MTTIGDLVEIFKVLFDLFKNLFSILSRYMGKEEEEEVVNDE